MRTNGTLKLTICGIAAAISAAGWAQQKPKPKMPRTPVHLGLTAQVATTTDDGYPSSLRVTLTNDGNVTVDMPVPGTGYAPDRGIRLHVDWQPLHPASNGYGGGIGGGDSDVPPLMYRIQHDWVRLRPGEHLTESVQIRWVAYEAGPGTVTYWVVYTPPDATAVQVNKLMQDGTYIPTEKLETPHVSFNVN